MGVIREAMELNVIIIIIIIDMSTKPGERSLVISNFLVLIVLIF